MVNRNDWKRKKVNANPGVAVRYHVSCPHCGSSDARTEYSNGLGHCFSCGVTSKTEVGAAAPLNTPRLFSPLHTFSSTTTSKEEDVLKKLSVIEDNHPKVSTTLGKYIGRKVDLSRGSQGNILTNKSVRGLSSATLDFYHVQHDGEVFHLPYNSGKAFKIRPVKPKAHPTKTTGQFKEAGLFGMERFSQASASAITITEGEADAMAVFQMMGSKYPAVSIKNGAQHARACCEEAYEYINAFDKVYICFDNDEVGKEAAADVASLFDPNKTYVVELTKHKDANDYLIAGDDKEFARVWWNTKRWRPKGIVSGYDEVTGILGAPGNSSIATYPFPKLDEMACGIQSGQVILVTAKEKVGKTEFLRAIEYHLLKTTDFNLGIIHLEEKERRAIQGLVGYELSQPVHRPDSNVSLEDQVAAYKALTKRDDRVFYYQHFGSEDPNVILSVLRYMVSVNRCKFVFLDHITMLVTGFEGDDERKKLDYLSTKMAELTRELDFTLFLVSHVNDDNKTRGSRAISQLASLRVHISRDKEAADPEVRNTMNVMVIDNRDGSDTGPSNPLRFDRKTYKLEEIQPKSYEASLRDGEKTLEKANVVDFSPLF
jgi:twinkle protein